MDDQEIRDVLDAALQLLKTAEDADTDPAQAQQALHSFQTLYFALQRKLMNRYNQVLLQDTANPRLFKPLATEQIVTAMTKWTSANQVVADIDTIIDEHMLQMVDPQPMVTVETGQSRPIDRFLRIIEDPKMPLGTSGNPGTTFPGAGGGGRGGRGHGSGGAGGRGGGAGNPGGATTRTSGDRGVGFPTPRGDKNKR